ncbi:MAG TPA: hypothetical protein VEZ50_17470 [Nodosilinea sp.]|nr:hypothetical protein [Nodosilinea sp.]
MTSRVKPQNTRSAIARADLILPSVWPFDTRNASDASGLFRN